MTTPEDALEAEIQKRAPMSARLRDKLQAEGGLSLHQFAEEALGIMMALEMRVSFLQQTSELDFEAQQLLERGGS